MLKTISPLLAAAALVAKAWAQSSDATCPSSYSWANNKLGQSPCLVAAYLIQQCDAGGEIDIPVLPAGKHYDPGEPDDCYCNTIVYSLVAACGDCQGRQYDKWSYWSENCTVPFVGVYPEIIPSGTSIPSWAYLDVEITNYNATTARQYALKTAPKKKSNVGAIAGGVVAGVLVLAIAAGGFIWWKKKKAAQAVRGGESIAPLGTPGATEEKFNGSTYNGQQQYGAEQQYGGGPQYGAGGAAMSPALSALNYSDMSPPMSPPVTLSTTPKPYDPADPSTFPHMQNAGGYGGGYGQVGGAEVAQAGGMAGYGSSAAGYGMPVPQQNPVTDAYGRPLSEMSVQPAGAYQGRPQV